MPKRNKTWLLGAWKILVYLGRAWERRSPAHVFHRTGLYLIKFFSSLALSTVIHEAGHALAAVDSKVWSTGELNFI